MFGFQDFATHIANYTLWHNMSFHMMTKFGKPVRSVFTVRTFVWFVVIYGAKYLVFSPLFPSKREKNILVLLSLYIFLREVCLLFNFIIQKLNTLPSKNIQTEQN